MEKKALEDSGSEILNFNINLCLADYSCFMGTTIPQSLFHFTGSLDWRDHIFNEAQSVQMEGKQTSAAGNEDKDKPSLFMSRE